MKMYFKFVVVFPGNRTLFAPLNSAFKSVPASVQERWSSDRAFLKDTILYHLVTNNYRENDLTNDLILNTNNPGFTLRVNRYQLEKVFVFPFICTWLPKCIFRR